MTTQLDTINWHIKNDKKFIYLDECSDYIGKTFTPHEGNFTECKKCRRRYLEPQSTLDLMPMITNIQPEFCPKCRN